MLSMASWDLVVQDGFNLRVEWLPRVETQPAYKMLDMTEGYENESVTFTLSGSNVPEWVSQSVAVLNMVTTQAPNNVVSGIGAHMDVGVYWLKQLGGIGNGNDTGSKS